MCWEPVVHHLAWSWLGKNQYSHFHYEHNNKDSPKLLLLKLLYSKMGRDVTEMHSKQLAELCSHLPSQTKSSFCLLPPNIFPQRTTFLFAVSPYSSGEVDSHAWFRRLSDPDLSQSAHYIFPSHSHWLQNGHVRWEEIFSGNSGKLSLAVTWEGGEKVRSGAAAGGSPWSRKSHVVNREMEGMGSRVLIGALPQASPPTNFAIVWVNNFPSLF